MKNFFGRIIILICSIIHCVMFFIILGTALFYIIENANSLENFFSGNLTSLDYTGLFFAIIDFIVFIIITLICLIDIINARSMKHAFIWSIILFCINIFTFLFNLLIPHLDSIYYGILLGCSGTTIGTSLFLVIGSGFNYYKDCR